MDTTNILVAQSDVRAVQECVWGWYKSQGLKGPVAMPSQRSEIDGRTLFAKVPKDALPLLNEQGIGFELFD